MFLLPDLSLRNRQPEIMDQPDLDAGEHVHALRCLERVNIFSRSAAILWGELSRLARNSPAPLRILDVATGAGDLPIRLWQKAQKAGLAVQVEGCDISPVALEHAQQRAKACGAEVRFFPIDFLTHDLTEIYDAVTCSLFLHHLDEGPAVELLRRMGKAARQMVLVNDLRRSRLGYALAYLGTRVLSTSWVARIDGPRSVEGSYTPQEAIQLAERAGLVGATAVRRWPCRYLLAWRRPGVSEVK